MVQGGLAGQTEAELEWSECWRDGCQAVCTLCERVLHGPPTLRSHPFTLCVTTQRRREAHRGRGDGINLTRGRGAAVRSLTAISLTEGVSLGHCHRDGGCKLRHNHRVLDEATIPHARRRLDRHSCTPLQRNTPDGGEVLILTLDWVCLVHVRVHHGAH